MYVSIIAKCVWSIWSNDYIENTAIKTAHQLEKYIETAMCNNGTEIPHIYVIYNNKTNALIGFCFIEINDADVNPRLTPWLSNVYILPEYRGNGYCTQLLRHVITRYSPLYLWTDCWNLVKYYGRFGFYLIQIKTNHGSYKILYIMQRI